jgi:hypothetical protein
MAQVQTKDGFILEVPQGLVDECETLKMVCEMTDCTEDTWAPLPNVDAATMETVIRFFESESLPAFTDLYPLLEAADYLGYEKLLDKGCESFAEALKGRAPEEIRRLCGLEEPGA